MADEEPESFIEKVTREKTLALRAEGGRVFVESAVPDRLDRSTIELKCCWSPGLVAMFDSAINIGDDKHKPFTWDENGVQVPDEEAEDVIGWSLLDCPIMLSIYRIEDGWLADNANRPKDDPIIGRFNFHAPIQTSDGVVSEERPTIHAWVALGPDNFKLLRDRLAATDTPDFDLGLKVEFSRGTVETGWVKSKIEWDGKGALPVTGATIVWKRGDWNSDTQRERQVRREPEEYQPPREHVQLMNSMKRLEDALTKLALPVWVAVGAAIVAAIAAR